MTHLKTQTYVQEPQLLGRGLNFFLIKQHFKHAFFNKITSVSFTCIYLQSVTNVRLSHSNIYQVSLQNKNKQYVFATQ